MELCVAHVPLVVEEHSDLAVPLDARHRLDVYLPFHLSSFCYPNLRSEPVSSGVLPSTSASTALAIRPAGGGHPWRK